MYLLFDIGGTNMRLAVSEDGEHIGTTETVRTPKNLDEGVRLFSDIAQKLSGGRSLKAAVGGIPGPFVGLGETLALKTPNLPEWNNRPLQALFRKSLDIPFFFQNDCDLIGLGEAVYGAGREKNIVAYMTISTGVGGTRIVDRKIDQSAFGLEPGHQIIDFDKSFAPDTIGSLEELIGGAGLKRRYRKASESIADTRLWDQAAEMLAYGLHNMVVFWSPEIVILGGSVMNSIDLEKVRGYLKNIQTTFPTLPRIVLGALGDTGGFWGALAYIKQNKI